MARKSKDSEEFNELKRLGLNFSSPDTNFQPDSSGTASGVVGAQEYGILTADDLNEEQIFELVDQSRNISEQPLGVVEDIESGFTGASEWSIEHAADPEKIVEKAEKFANEEEERKAKKSNLKLVQK